MHQDITRIYLYDQNYIQMTVNRKVRLLLWHLIIFSLDINMLRRLAYGLARMIYDAHPETGKPVTLQTTSLPLPPKRSPRRGHERGMHQRKEQLLPKVFRM